MAKKNLLLVLTLGLGSMFAAGCATKGYVRSQVQPVNTKVGQVQQESQAQIKETNGKLDQTNQQLSAAQTKLDATAETADAADSRSTSALNGVKQNSSQINNLNNFAANLDTYKSTDQTVVHFAFNKAKLSTEDMAELDKVATEAQGQKRYVITVRGFTDQTGPTDYDVELSSRRAESVIRYLVGQHNIPIYLIHMVGMGKSDLVNNGKTRQDRADSRRVEVDLYTAPSFSGSPQSTN
ncbi:MAG TPA: OmpA family protein [Candidatus Dormibacteraeota bacterium]|nr:OmpA family protein [Candidatus Dormibacteraeota bacterium]